MFSLYLSPYLRPFLDAGQLVYDNGLTGAVERLDPLEHEVVRALWDAPDPGAPLLALAAAHGEAALVAAIEALAQKMMVFRDRAQCDLAFDALLDAGTPPVPFIDQVELTNRCPFRCAFCPRGVPGKMERPVGFMDLALFERLLDQLHPMQARYRPLELHHLGESLLHPEVDRFAAAASARGLPTEMSVNPALLTPDLAHRLLAAGLRRLVISLDGMDDETSVAIRGPAARYDKSARHLDALLEAVAAMPSPPAVIIQMIDLHKNRHQREAFLARWGKSGLPTVNAVIKDLDGPDPDLGRPTSRPLVYLCSYPWRSVVVLWDGRVVPCCRDDDARLVLGDLKVESLAQIWRGPKAVELRRQHRTGDVAEGHLCHGCDWRRERFADAMPSRHPDRARPNPYQW
ncbi:MAG: radical SAM/SPASM domain-containing protein [Minicystis sp.]